MPDPRRASRPTTQDPNKKIVVTYSSINGNGFGGYGEVVMGTKGTLVVEREQEVMLYKDSSTTTRVGVKEDDGGADPGHPGQRQHGGHGQGGHGSHGPVSRGYTEEIEHWAWCIRIRTRTTNPAVTRKWPWATPSSHWPPMWPCGTGPAATAVS